MQRRPLPPAPLLSQINTSSHRHTTERNEAEDRNKGKLQGNADTTTTERESKKKAVRGGEFESEDAHVTVVEQALDYRPMESYRSNGLLNDLS